MLTQVLGAIVVEMFAAFDNAFGLEEWSCLDAVE
jgi:hypothetical protein